jgi:DNA replication protein DnaC
MSKHQEEIILRGASGVGKTLYANAISRNAARGDIRLVICDHYLYTNHPNFQRDFEKIRSEHLNTGANLSIIVIDDGGSDLMVTFTHGLSFDLAQVLFYEPT